MSAERVVLFLFTFIVSDDDALLLVSIKYWRLALKLLFLCFFLNSSTTNPKEEEEQEEVNQSNNLILVHY